MKDGEAPHGGAYYLTWSYYSLVGVGMASETRLKINNMGCMWQINKLPLAYTSNVWGWLVELVG